MPADSAPLPPTDAARLAEFARACKAAARAVTLYPEGHPAIRSTVGRIVDLTASEHLAEPLRIGVLTDNLLLNHRALERSDPAVVELAALLHGHLIGELVVHAGGDVAAWRTLLLLLGRPADAVREEGGVTQLWAARGGPHVEIREIDYAEVLRERQGGGTTAWDRILNPCLHGDSLDIRGDVLRDLLKAAGSASDLDELLAAVEGATGKGDVGVRTAAIVRVFQAIAEAVGRHTPERMDAVVDQMATAVGKLSPTAVAGLLAARSGSPPSGAAADKSGARLIDSITNRLSDETIAGFVAHNAFTDDEASIARVAQAFQTLVRDDEHCERLLALAHDSALASAEGATEHFEEKWNQIAEKVLKSYSDKPFVSAEYARELSTVRAQAVEVEQLQDDPPERVHAWISTVATSELRTLDLTLVRDLLRIEEDPGRWSGLMRPVASLLEDLLLVGDIDAAADLLGIVVAEARPDSRSGRREAAQRAVERLATGSMMRLLAPHLATANVAQFDQIKAMCLSMGDSLIRPLADALATEERHSPRERLAAILVGFGASGRREAERLKTSANAAVRRTAVYLLREFGGSDALPDLAKLLGDHEPQVQREAVKAILNIGSDRAYEVIEQALVSGTADSRDTVMQALGARDERSAPVFAYILEHVDHRGELASIYVRAIEGLGALKDPAGVQALKQALYRGEWWAPRRTASLRLAAAHALARIGTPEARAALEEASRTGPRGVRAAARDAAGGSS